MSAVRVPVPHAELQARLEAAARRERARAIEQLLDLVRQLGRHLIVRKQAAS